MKKLGLLLLACITALNLWAEEFKIGKFTFKTITPTTVELIDADADNTNVFLSETIDYKGNSYTITSIGNKAFEDCKSLTSVTIPNSVTSIGHDAFSGCPALSSPIYNIHCFAFMPTSYSGAYTIPNSIKQIVGGAFRGCTSLTSVTIPKSVTSIGDGAFEDCTSLTSVTIPKSVTRIGALAFQNTALYKDLANWENGALYIDNCLIEVAKGFVGHFRIKENTRVIAGWAFWGCSSLTSLTIPKSITSIDFYAFMGCKSLTSVTIPSSVTSIEHNAFAGTALYNDPANWENGALYIDNCLIKVAEGFAGHFRIKENTRVIAEYAFRECSALISVTIPKSVTSIGILAFPEHTKIIRQ